MRSIWRVRRGISKVIAGVRSPLESGANDVGVLRRSMRKQLGAAIINRLQRSAPQFVDGSAVTLVIAPHPDDDVLGCGGVIAQKCAAGQAVHVAFLTDGSASHRGIDPRELATIRRTEATECARRLGVAPANLHFLDYPDGQVLEIDPDSIIGDFLLLLRKISPQAVYIPHLLEPTLDHKVTATCAYEAIQRAEVSLKVYEYGIWYWHHWPWISILPSLRAYSRGILSSSLKKWFGLGCLWDFNCVVDIADVLDQKAAALSAHVSQVKGLDRDTNAKSLSEVADGTFLPNFLGNVEFYRIRTVGRSYAARERGDA